MFAGPLRMQVGSNEVPLPSIFTERLDVTGIHIQCSSAECRCPVAALAFLEQDSAAAGRVKQAGTGSPLLILTEDRQYHIAYPGAAADSVSADARAELTLAQGVMLTLMAWAASTSGPLLL